MKIAQVVLGPAGTGKTTYCQTIQKYCDDAKRVVHIMNLDPAAVDLPYSPSIDIRELISLEDVMDELKYGPNGGLVYCLEFLIENLDWLTEQLGDYADDYLIIDCPGQIELYSHMSAMTVILNSLVNIGFNICTIYLLDSTFINDPAKFISGSLAALSCMVRLEKTHINVLTKMDLVKEARRRQRIINAKSKKANGGTTLVTERRALDGDDNNNDDDFERSNSIFEEAEDVDNAADDNDDDDADEDDNDFVDEEDPHAPFDGNANDDDDDDDAGGAAKRRWQAQRRQRRQRRRRTEDDDELREELEVEQEIEKYLLVDVDGVANELDATMPTSLRNLNHALGSLLDEFGLVQFIPLDITRNGSIQSLMLRIDMATQFGEDEEVRVPRDEEIEGEPITGDPEFVQ